MVVKLTGPVYLDGRKTKAGPVYLNGKKQGVQPVRIGPSKTKKNEPVSIWSDEMILAKFIERLTDRGQLAQLFCEESDSGVRVFLATKRILRGQGRK